MSSGPDPAILIFPTGIDIYSTKVDRGDVISGEPHTVPVGSPYTYFLDHVPQESTISVPGYVEVTGTPLANQYQTIYSGLNAGQLTFNGINAGSATLVTYTAAGDVVRAEWFNSLQVSVTGIETFIQDGLGITGTFMPFSGGTFIGDVTINGFDFLTSLSGSNNVGAFGTPFSSMYANTFFGDTLSNPAASSVITLTPSMTLAGTEINFVGNDFLFTASNTGTTFIGDVNVSGNISPINSSGMDLGAPATPWDTIYASNLVVAGLSDQFVARAGDSMYGDLDITGTAALVTDLIKNNLGNLALTSTAGINLTAASAISIGTSTAANIDISTFGGQVSINSSIVFGPGGIAILGDMLPDFSGSHNLGSPSLPYNAVYANNIVGLQLSGNFVSKIGDSMSGSLVMGDPAGTGTQPSIYTESIISLAPSSDLAITAGELNFNATNNVTFDLGPSGNQVFQIGLSNIYWSTDFLPTISGTFDIGSPSLYVDYVYANNIVAKVLQSGVEIPYGAIGDLSVTGTITMGTGSSIVPSQSGTVTIGSSGNPIGNLYVDNIISNGSTGTYVQKAGDGMTGDLTMTGANILTGGSGTNTIGTAATPFEAIYADNISSTGLDGQYVKKIGDSMSGSLTLPSLLSTGNMIVSGVGTIDMLGNEIAQTAETINITSTVGATIIDANTELQLLSGGVAKAVIGNSGTEFYNNIYPDTSGNHTVGTAERPWAAIYANSFVGTSASGTGTYVLKIGDSMSGDLTLLVGTDLLSAISGSSNVGSLTNPFGYGYFDNLSIGGVGITGLYVAKAGDTMTGDLSSSASIWNIGTSSGGGEIMNLVAGSGLNLYSQSGADINIYSDNDVNFSHGGDTFFGQGGDWTLSNGGSNTSITSNLTQINAGGSQVNVGSNDLFLKGTSGEYLMIKSGEIIIATPNSGNTNVVFTNSNTEIHKDLVPDASGNNNIGTSSLPFSEINVTGINGRISTYPIYNEIPSGAIDGVNTIYYTANFPFLGTDRLYRAGLRMSPGGVDYTMSGSGITFTTAPNIGDNILIDYESPVY